MHSLSAKMIILFLKITVTGTWWNIEFCLSVSKVFAQALSVNVERNTSSSVPSSSVAQNKDRPTVSNELMGFIPPLQTEHILP